MTFVTIGDYSFPSEHIEFIERRYFGPTRDAYVLEHANGRSYYFEAGEPGYEDAKRIFEGQSQPQAEQTWYAVLTVEAGIAELVYMSASREKAEGALLRFACARFGLREHELKRSGNDRIWRPDSSPGDVAWGVVDIIHAEDAITLVEHMSRAMAKERYERERKESP